MEDKLEIKWSKFSNKVFLICWRRDEDIKIMLRELKERTFKNYKLGVGLVAL